jgi:hypothetical protein
VSSKIKTPRRSRRDASREFWAITRALSRAPQFQARISDWFDHKGTRRIRIWTDLTRAITQSQYIASERDTPLSQNLDFLSKEEEPSKGILVEVSLLFGFLHRKTQPPNNCRTMFPSCSSTTRRLLRRSVAATFARERRQWTSLSRAFSSVAAITREDSSALSHANDDDDDTDSSSLTERMNLFTAINNAMAIALQTDESAVVFGEDVAFGGVFRCSQTLREQFGEDRVFNTPLSENGIAGFAIGYASMGGTAIGEVRRRD